MSQNQIKWLATLLMVIDHVGFVIESEPMRIIGRLSFPLFAWILAINWERRKGKSPKELIRRLIVFGIVAQIPYILLFTNLRLNVLISYGLTTIVFSEVHKLEGNKKIMAVIVGCLTAEIIGVEYGWYSIICTLMMINFSGTGSKRWWISWTIVNILYCITARSYIQAFAILTPVLLSRHDRKKDRKPTTIEKKFFYHFYPIHLAGLAALRTIL